MVKNFIEEDWERMHRVEMVKSVIGKEMDMNEFWESGHLRFINTTVPLVRKYFPIEEISQKTFLEIGCGPGRIIKPIAMRAKKVIGVDVSPTIVEIARNNLRLFDNVDIIKNSGHSLESVDNESVDVVISFDVFQHMPTLGVQLSYLRETFRVLKPNGIFIIQVKTNSGWMRVFGIPVVPRSLREYLPKGFIQMLHKLSGKREHRLRSTWRGNLLPNSQLHRVFLECGLKVEGIIPDGHGTRWVVHGRRC